MQYLTKLQATADWSNWAHFSLEMQRSKKSPLCLGCKTKGLNAASGVWCSWFDTFTWSHPLHIVCVKTKVSSFCYVFLYLSFHINAETQISITHRWGSHHVCCVLSEHDSVTNSSIWTFRFQKLISFLFFHQCSNTAFVLLGTVSPTIHCH